ncbi:copper ion binding protein [candidate division KSB1 bacterium]|nr:copper ion binding protein [candidate division KSB1 bacterium]NIR70812.1 copper ion binding protein [candidate division KSB1 bacterium]NIS27824.1 copper ion binding protein [candidate division KSB1 bacterium]NIT74706.1 copper ion binding protein [candidate division KSB1 bacterium]NIU28489.1 copper ion binding protein [candidate division KSB1 bacterium]
MTNIRTIATIILSILVTMAFSVASIFAGQRQKVTLRVDGLACPFCAYGMEKKLKRLEGVEKLDIKINEGLVLLYFKDRVEIDKELIAKKVKEAGFTSREITIEKPVAKSEAKPQKVALNIEGMRCQGCVSRVKTALSKVDCVKEVAVSLEENKATVLCTGSDKDQKKLVEAVDKLGFQTKIAEVNETAK